MTVSPGSTTFGEKTSDSTKGGVKSSLPPVMLRVISAYSCVVLFPYLSCMLTRVRYSPFLALSGIVSLIRKTSATLSYASISVSVSPKVTSRCCIFINANESLLIVDTKGNPDSLSVALTMTSTTSPGLAVVTDRSTLCITGGVTSAPLAATGITLIKNIINVNNTNVINVVLRRDRK